MTRGGRFAVLLAVGLGVGIVYSLLDRAEAGRGVATRIGTPAAGRVEKDDAAWKAELGSEAYRVTRRRGTERAFSGAYWNAHSDGNYGCVCCGQPLFDSAAKFDSGTGWPSFSRPADEEAISLFEDRTGFEVRTEVACSRCDAHLGHVFDDGPPPTGRRYCLNSAALTFVPRPTEATVP